MSSWWCGSSVGGPAQQVPSPEVKPQHCQKKKKKKKVLQVKEIQRNLELCEK
jgi:hypothetical protein